MIRRRLAGQYIRPFGHKQTNIHVRLSGQLDYPIHRLHMRLVLHILAVHLQQTVVHADAGLFRQRARHHIIDHVLVHVLHARDRQAQLAGGVGLTQGAESRRGLGMDCGRAGRVDGSGSGEGGLGNWRGGRLRGAGAKLLRGLQVLDLLVVYLAEAACGHLVVEAVVVALLVDGEECELVAGSKGIEDLLSKDAVLVLLDVLAVQLDEVVVDAEAYGEKFVGII